jgi:alpha-glucosidase
MDTQVGFINKLDVATFRSKLTTSKPRSNGNTPLLVFDNHDNPRIDARYGDGVHTRTSSASSPPSSSPASGTALFYYGDEIGMKTTPPTRKEDVKDPVGLTGWPKDKGRDGERTPMQWDDSTYAGFSTVQTPGSPSRPTRQRSTSRRKKPIPTRCSTGTKRSSS